MDENEGNPPVGGPAPIPSVIGVIGVGGPYDEVEILVPVGITLVARAPVTAVARGGTC